ncbi:putative ABC transporter ATP-binding protein YknY [Abditibacteriota bacterium]|nr:putative ABC transporter ATP-binding protein YknY [Abditibacteriota bacterium]
MTSATSTDSNSALPAMGLDATPDEAYNASENIVRVRGVKRTYYIGENPVHALRGIDLDIKRGEFMAIMGPSGSGKSTLFNMVGGLDKPTSGTVFIDEVDIAQLDPGELAWLRCRKIGYIFQTFNLIPVMTALENVTLPMIFAGASLEEQMEKGRRLLELVGLGHRLHNKPGQLSGGQQQRVAIARALANDPAIILADEPTGNLDQKVGEEIIMMLKRLNKESGVTVITATHDDKMYKRSDRVAIVIDGEIQAVIPPDLLGDNTVDGFLQQMKDDKEAAEAAAITATNETIVASS